MRRFALSDPVFVVETAAAQIWRARREGALVGFKLYPRGHMGNEATGHRYLERHGPIAVQILEQTQDALVMEWLAGPSLGDLARAGRALDVTDADLAQVAAGLMACESNAEGLRPVVELFDGFLAADLGEAEGSLQTAQAMARALLAEPGEQVALHGDLHPDNIIMVEGTCRVFDAKGLIGPRAYELANAFRHPRGCTPEILQPDRIICRLRAWSIALGCRPADLRRWAIAKTGLSVFWAQTPAEADLTLLRVLLAMGE